MSTTPSTTRWTTSRESVRLPGFRKGKAPKGLVMQRVGRDAVIEEALEHHLSAWYRRAVAVSGIDPVDRPTIDWSRPAGRGRDLPASRPRSR